MKKIDFNIFTTQTQRHRDFLKFFSVSLCLCGLIFLFAASAFSAGKFADFGGVKIHYNDTGKGKNALVFIHGWTCSADFWAKSTGAFPDYRVIALDLPGHGESDKPKAIYSMEYFAKAVEAVMKDADVKKAVLVGHSMGTPVARQFYRLYPKKTAAIVIVDGALRPMAEKKDMDNYIAFLKSDYKGNAPKMVDGMLLSITDQNLKKQIRDAMLSTPDYVALSAMEAMADEKIYTNDKIEVPVMAILAESPYWKPDTQDFLKTIAPDLDFRMWQGVSHFLMMERPEVFNQSIKFFVRKNKLL